MAERGAALSIPILVLLFFLLALPAGDDPGHRALGPDPLAAQLMDAAATNDLALQAPGATLATAPALAFARLLTPDASLQRHLARLLTLTLLVLLAGIILFRLLPDWGVNDGLRLIAVGSFTVGTFAWASFTVLAGPGFAAALILLGLLLLVGYRQRPQSVRTLALSGLCFGLAVVFEYPTAVLGLAAGMYLFSFERRPARLVAFVVGAALLPALIIGLHNTIIFGEVLPRGMFGIGMPTPANLEQLLFRPAKGMFFWSPVLHIGLIGMILMIRHRRREGLLLTGMFTAMVLLIAGRGDAAGEAGFGPQQLTALVGPLLVAAVWLATLTGSYGRGIFTGLAIGSSLLATVGVTVAPLMPGRVANPLWEFALPMLRENIGADNLLGLSTRPALWMTLAVVVALWFVILWYAKKDHAKSDRRFFRSLGLTIALACLFYAGVSPLLAKTEASVLHQVKGRHCMTHQAYQRAADEFEQAVTERPDPWSLYYLARAYYLSGREADGDRALQRLLAIDPTFQPGDEP